MINHSNFLNYISDILNEMLSFEQFYTEDINFQIYIIKFKSDKQFIQLYNILNETLYEIIKLKKIKDYWFLIAGYKNINLIKKHKKEIRNKNSKNNIKNFKGEDKWIN
jgi:hypothetical protein